MRKKFEDQFEKTGCKREFAKEEEVIGVEGRQTGLSTASRIFSHNNLSSIQEVTNEVIVCKIVQSMMSQCVFIGSSMI